MSYWMQGLANRSESTRSTYRYDFLKFAEWMQKTPNDLFDLQLQAQQQQHDDPRDRHHMENAVIRYIAHLDESDISVSTQKRRYAAINSFFRINQVPLMLQRGDTPTGDSFGGSKIPSTAQIREMVENCVTPEGKIRLQYQALIMVLKDTGLRISDAIRLRWSEMIELGDGFYAWELISQKRRIRATPMIGPETSILLQQLKQARERDPYWQDDADDRIFPLKRRTAITKLSDILLVVPDVSAHGLRKYFSVTMLHAGIAEPEVKMMMGKATTPYHENRLEKLSESYMHAYDALRIYPKPAQQKEVNALQQEVAELRAQLEQIQASRQDTDDLMNRLVDDPEFAMLLRRKMRELS
jgi:integrase